MTARWIRERIALDQRRAVTTICLRCGADVLAGLNDDVAAIAVLVDAAPVEVAAAVLAFALGRPAGIDGSVVHAVIHGELHRLDGYGIASAVGNRRQLHLVHDCPLKEIAA